MEQQDILVCRRRHFAAHIMFREILFDFTIDKMCLSEVFSWTFLEFFSLDEPLCQAHQHFGILQSLVATALFYRVHFAGIVPVFNRGCLTAVPACRSSVRCLVLFSLANQVPWRFIDPFFVRRLFILKMRDWGNLWCRIIIVLIIFYINLAWLLQLIIEFAFALPYHEYLFQRNINLPI